jgi:adenylate kinase
MTVIAISGVGATGKTTTAKLLSKELKCKLIRLDRLAKRKKIFIGYDKKRKSFIVNISKLKKELKRIVKKNPNLVLESLYAHEFPADFVFILRCHPKVLEKRLKKKYTWPTKIVENKEAEMIGLITQEALDFNKNVFEIDTTKKTPQQIVKCMEEVLSGKISEYEVGRIDWLKEI